jgi:alpha-1,2-mannosyltransferase
MTGTRAALTAGFVLLLAACTAGWVRSAWLMPLDNYPFDFAINYTGARLLSLTGADAPIYDRAALSAEAESFNAYSALYTKLYLTYIQTPLTAVILMPVAGLTLDQARLAVLIVSNAFLVVAAAITVLALRPTRLVVAAAFVIFATFEAMFDSLRLGNVDGVIVLLLALSFLALVKDRAWLIGAPLAAAAVLKLSPAIIAGYFLWRREWKVVAGGIVAGVVLLAASLAVAGVHNHIVFVQETAPRLSKGSSFYDNIALGGALARAYFGEWSWYHEDELPPWPAWLRGLSLIAAAVIVVGGYVAARRDREAGFMLATVSAVLVAPIAWSFYPTWLIPSFLFLVARCEQRRAWGRLALFVLLYPTIAIVPAHLSDWFGPEIYRLPLKTVALALYWALLAWEAQAGPIPAGRSQPAHAAARPRPSPAGARP